MAKDNNIQDDDVLNYEDDFLKNQFFSAIDEDENESFETDLEQLLGMDSMFYSEEEETIPDLMDELSGIDMSMEGILSGMDLSSEEKNENSPENQTIDSPEDDILSLLGQIKTDDPVADDIQAISDMLTGKISIETEVKGKPTDVGDVFNNALRAVNSLEDQDDVQNDLLPEEELSKGTKKARKVKPKKEKKQRVKKEKKPRVKKEKVKKEKASKKNTKEVNDVNPKDVINSQEQNPPKGKVKAAKKSAKVKDPNKKSFMELLFGPEDEEDVKNKEEIAAAKSKSKGATAKKKTGKKAKGTDEADGTKASKKSATKKAKSVDKVKKPKKEKVQIIDDIADEGIKINPIGASAVFIFFGVLVIILLVGTNIFSYSLSIQNATSYFNRNRYNQAYNEVYGIDIKDEDIEIYDKIMTVMFVNKQLNSYNNFYAMNKYPEALDSLLKGLERYDKYYELATILGIDSDLDYVRDKILTELKNVFGLTEKQALKILNSKDQTTYSIKVYDTVLENMKRDE